MGALVCNGGRNSVEFLVAIRIIAIVGTRARGDECADHGA